MRPPSQQNPLMGVLWMIVTGILFVGVTATVKVAGTGIPAAESAFIRYCVGTVLLLPILGALLRTPLSRGQLALFGLRGVAHTGAVILWFFAMARIPIADVTAMNYMSPIYVTIGAVFILGEKMALRRILAVFASLVGALIILRPGFRELSLGHFAMIFAAMGFGVSYLTAKRVSDQVSPLIVVVMLSLTVTIGLAPFALANWVMPTQREFLLLSGVAVLATAAHYTMSLAFRAAPVSVTQPVTFLQLVWAVLLGVVVFGEPLDPFVILGALVIVGSISYISWREAVLRKRSVTPPVSATK